MDETWLTSDLHLFHRNIIVYCGRPYDDEYQMNAHIVRCWNESVKEVDRVIMVGDLSAGVMGRYEELSTLIGQLRGRKTLIRGNHDHQTDAWYKAAGFADVHDWLIVDDKLFIHKPATNMNLDAIKIVEQVQPRLVVHGHIHDDRPNIPGHFNVAWDRHKRLIKMSEIDTPDRSNV